MWNLRWSQTWPSCSIDHWHLRVDWLTMKQGNENRSFVSSKMLVALQVVPLLLLDILHRRLRQFLVHHHNHSLLLLLPHRYLHHHCYKNKKNCIEQVIHKKDQITWTPFDQQMVYSRELDALLLFHQDQSSFLKQNFIYIFIKPELNP